MSDMAADWRFKNSPHVALGGLRAYAGTQLCLDTEDGDRVAFGSICVASNTPQQCLTRMQQMMLTCIGDSVVADIVQSTRYRRQRDRRAMVDLLTEAQKHVGTDALDARLLSILRKVYPEAVVSIQSSLTSHISYNDEFGQQVFLAFSDFENGYWEDITYIDSFIEHFNHRTPVAARAIRIMAANIAGPPTPTFVSVQSRDLRLVFDDVDKWFVQSCATIASQSWHKMRHEQSAQVKQSFLRDITHQLRTPLHGILGSAELLAEELTAREIIAESSGALNFDRNGRACPHSYLRAITASGQDLISIINNLLTLNKWAGMIPFRREGEIVHFSELETVLSDAIRKSISDDCRYGSPVFFSQQLPAYCDIICSHLGILKDCLLPIIANAMQHTMHGIVQVNISANDLMDELIFDILDNGSGIERDNHSRIFQSYEKVEKGSIRTGLGLTIAAQVASLLNGRVTLIDSALSKGSHFRIAFADVFFASSYARQDELLGSLNELPHSFHAMCQGGNAISLVSLFCNFLLQQGFTSSQSGANAFWILCDDHPSQLQSLPPGQVAIYLWSESSRSAVPDLPNHVVMAKSPFTKQCLITALRQADFILGQTLNDSVTSTAASIENGASHDITCPKLAQSPRSLSTANSTTSWSEHQLDLQMGDLNVRDRCDSKDLTPSITSILPKLAGTTTALLVDDNIINLKFLQAYCARRKIDCRTASNGQQAIDVYAKDRGTTGASSNNVAAIQFVLMDLQMPVRDGVEATRQIRRLEEMNGWSRTLIIMVSGQDSAADQERAMQAGADEYLVKPVSMKLLDRHLAHWL